MDEETESPLDSLEGDETWDEEEAALGDANSSANSSVAGGGTGSGGGLLGSR